MAIVESVEQIALSQNDKKYIIIFFAGIAQLVEQLICNHQVPSSTLGAGTILYPKNHCHKMQGMPLSSVLH